MMEERYVHECPNHAANLNSMNNMRLNNKWCDVIIRVKGSEIRAHKIVLAANLSYFQTIFSDAFSQENMKGIVTLNSVKGPDLEAFISYAYTGKILLTDNNALSLLETANELGEVGIKEACIDFLKRRLKEEDALRVYIFANIFGYFPLKIVAKWRVLSNFVKFSQTTDYLNFKCESMTDILSGGKTHPVESQRMFFEGIMRWIMHDPRNRRIHAQDLLNTIGFTTLTREYLIFYLEYKACPGDEHGIANYIIACYDSAIKQQRSPSVLVILGNVHTKPHFQFYNFNEQSWSTLQTFSNAEENNSGAIISNAAVFNNKLCYVSKSIGTNKLHQFDPNTKKCTPLDYPFCNILKWSTLCAYEGFLYLCGGRNEDNSVSKQVLKYDPRIKSPEMLPPMQTKRYSAAAIFYQGCLHVLGGHDGSCLNSVEKYDPVRRQWTALPSMNHSRNCLGAAVIGGRLYACGGSHGNNIEVYNPTLNIWQLVTNSSSKPRADSLIFTHEDKLFIMGGNDDKMVEVYDPNRNLWEFDHQMSSGLKIECPKGDFMTLN